jgi:hypothetical protein
MHNIKDFRSEINKNGIIKPNRFMVNFRPPKTLEGRSTKEVILRCEALQWPGVSFTTLDAPPRAGYGAGEVIPFAPIFEDITLSFIVDKNSDIHKFFFNWINSVINLRSEGQSRFKDGAFEVGYKDDYSTDINISVYNETGTSNEGGDSPMMATLYRAYPRALPGFDLNWNITDEMLRLPVQFTYTDYFITYRSDTPVAQKNEPKMRTQQSLPAKTPSVQIGTQPPPPFEGGGGSFGGGGASGSF